MQEHVAHELNDADEQILDQLHDGRNLPQNLAELLGYSRQYVQNRLQMLKAADYVDNLGGGLYELTNDPRDDTADTLAENRRLRESTEQLKVDRDDLQDELDDAYERIHELEEQNRQAAVNADRARKALGRALDELPDDAPGRLAVADAREMLRGDSDE